MKSDEDFQERYGDDPDGLVAEFVSLGADEGNYLVKVPVKHMRVEDAGARNTLVVLACELFKGLFNDKMDGQTDLSVEDTSVYLEVPADKFQREWQAAVENSSGGFYVLSEEEVENEITRHVPKVVVVDEKEDEDE